MDAMTLLPRSRPLTEADLAAMPDDGHRYELIDGTLVVTPGPSLHHQGVLRQLTVLLLPQVPPGHTLLFAPFDVRLDEYSVLQPDLLVARDEDFDSRRLNGPPVLAVEVLSPSTRRIDLTLKKARYEAAGCAAYWVVDPETPSVTAWHLVAGEYVETARATGDEVLDVDRPFPIRLPVAELLR
jgi:Uma2 family endonuclease